MSGTHRCIVCGKSYKFCDSCRNVRGYTPWRTIADTVECYQLHLLIGICKREGATEYDFQNLKRLAAQVEMTLSVSHVVEQLLENCK